MTEQMAGSAASLGFGFMAAFAVSGSVVLIARQVHKRLLSNFMRQMEFELRGPKKCQTKKRVRFADDVLEPSSNNKEYRKGYLRIAQVNEQVLRIEDMTMIQSEEGRKLLEIMPINRQNLYKGIIEYKTLKGYSV